MHRTYHVSRMPTLNRKIRVVADWTLALFFRREIVSLGSLAAPFDEFEAAAESAGPRQPGTAASRRRGTRPAGRSLGGAPVAQRQRQAP